MDEERKIMAAINFESRLAQRLISYVVKVLESESIDKKSCGLTKREISERIGFTMRWASRHIDYMHESKQIHIKGYADRGDGLYKIATYAIGAGTDAVRPKVMTAHERTQAYRKRLHKDPEKLDEVNIRRRLKRIKPHADPLVAMFFGISA